MTTLTEFDLDTFERATDLVARRLAFFRDDLNPEPTENDRLIAGHLVGSLYAAGLISGAVGGINMTDYDLVQRLQMMDDLDGRRAAEEIERLYDIMADIRVAANDALRNYDEAMENESLRLSRIEIRRLREAFRINMLRLDPTLSHADIDRIINGD